MPLYLPRKVIAQPQGHFRVNWANPITAGLEVAVLHNQSNIGVINFANPFLSFTTSNSGSNFVKTARANPVGLGNSFADNNFSFNSSNPVGLRNPSPSGFSVGSVVLATASNNTYTIFAQDRGSSRIFQFRANASNQLELITFTGGTPQFSVASWPSRLTGGTVAAAASGTSSTLAVDGVLTKTSITSINNLSNTSEVLDIAKFGSTPAAPWVGSISLSALWSRRLSDNELSSWTNNPWQIFAPSSYTQLVTGAAPATTIYEFQTFGRGVGRGIARGIA